jgi:hypothetical protein
MTRAEFIEKYSGGHYGDVKSLENKFADLAVALFEGKPNTQTLTDDTTLTEEDSGQTFNVATNGKTITLPLITANNIGMKFRFRNTGADAAVELTISPNAADGINGSLPASTGANEDATTADGLISKASGVVDKDLVNTEATANNGDWVEIEAVAATEWFINGGVGIWASEG